MQRSWQYRVNIQDYLLGLLARNWIFDLINHIVSRRHHIVSGRLLSVGWMQASKICFMFEVAGSLRYFPVTCNFQYRCFFFSLSSNLNHIFIESCMKDISWRDLTQIFKFCLRIFQHKKFDASEIFYTKITSNSIRENLILQKRL